MDKESERMIIKAVDRAFEMMEQALFGDRMTQEDFDKAMSVKSDTEAVPETLREMVCDD